MKGKFKTDVPYLQPNLCIDKMVVIIAIIFQMSSN